MFIIIRRILLILIFPSSNCLFVAEKSQKYCIMASAISESVDLSNLSLVRAEERRCDFDYLYEKKSSQNLLFPGLTVTVFKTKSS